MSGAMGIFPFFFNSTFKFGEENLAGSTNKHREAIGELQVHSSSF